ncbi:MAG: CNP1-like family protein [Pseudomonadota bacterium]|nr:CNP1-like family protein [Pseudomonadota bacterium]
MKRQTLLLLLFALPATALSAERERPFIDEPEPGTPRSVTEPDYWEEGAAPLPAWPKDADLVEFQVDNDESPFRYFIDGKHLDAGADGIVRYTLVVESPTGARNVSFEGIRCTPKGVYKTYAYGVGDRFKAVAEGDWERIPTRGYDKYHGALYGQLLCVPLKFEPRPKKDMIRALRGRLQTKANTGFLPD